jgi:hypothetical protein
MRRIDAPRAKLGVEFGHRLQGVADQGERAVLHCVESSGVERDETRIWVECCPRACSEVHQPRAHGEDHIGLAGQRIHVCAPADQACNRQGDQTPISRDFVGTGLVFASARLVVGVFAKIADQRLGFGRDAFYSRPPSGHPGQHRRPSSPSASIAA